MLILACPDYFALAGASYCPSMKQALRANVNCNSFDYSQLIRTVFIFTGIRSALGPSAPSPELPRLAKPAFPFRPVRVQCPVLATAARPWASCPRPHKFEPVQAFWTQSPQHP